jgi:MORN repeat protein
MFKRHLRATALLIFCITFFSGCDKNSKDVSDTEIPDGLRKTYRKDGSILSEANYKNGKLDGVSKNYYKNGNVQNLITYKKGIKDGLVQTNYITGNLNRETTYKNGVIDGYKKIFFKNGKVSSEQRYQNDLPGLLKEFSSSGKEKSSYPELIIKPVNNIIATGEYILEVTFSENSKRAQYYDGELIEGEFFDEFDVIKLANLEGVGLYRIKVNPGDRINNTVTLIGVLKTPRRNSYIVQKSFQLSIRG